MRQLKCGLCFAGIVQPAFIVPDTVNPLQETACCQTRTSKASSGALALQRGNAMRSLSGTLYTQRLRIRACASFGDATNEEPPKEHTTATSWVQGTLCVLAKLCSLYA